MGALNVLYRLGETIDADQSINYRFINQVSSMYQTSSYHPYMLFVEHNLAMDISFAHHLDLCRADPAVIGTLKI